MGCTSSKHAQRQAGPDSRKAPFPRIVSMPVYHPAQKEGDSHHLVALTSTSYGILRIEHSADDRSGYVGLKVVRNDSREDIDGFGSWVVSESPQTFGSLKLQPVEEEIREAETINTWELMQGLESRTPSPMKSNPSSVRQTMVDRSMSAHTVEELDISLCKMNSSKLFIWRKYLQGSESSKEKVIPWDESPVTPPAKSRFNLLSPSTTWTNNSSASKSFSSMDWAEGRAGLRLLLSPSNPSCSSGSGSTLIKKPSLSRQATLKFDVELDHEISQSSARSQGSPKNSSKCLLYGWTASSEKWESDSPLFDPVLLATFEKALESACESKWDSTNGSTSSSSSCTSFSSETSSDEESPHTNIIQLEGSVSLWENAEKKHFGAVQEESIDDCNRDISFSKVFPLTKEEENWKRLESLEDYELLCPPGGQSKVVLYFTSLRGIRRTFEDCCSIRIILRGFRLHVDERNVWMHSKFREELADLLGKGVIVPRLFIRGRYIGGAEEVKQLHEDGILVKLLEGFLIENSIETCDGCGDVRFLPCLTCNGSCKIIDGDNRVARCPDCNENGLILCPVCS